MPYYCCTIHSVPTAKRKWCRCLCVVRSEKVWAVSVCLIPFPSIHSAADSVSIAQFFPVVDNCSSELVVGFVIGFCAVLFPTPFTLLSLSLSLLISLGVKEEEEVVGSSSIHPANVCLTVFSITHTTTTLFWCSQSPVIISLRIEHTIEPFLSFSIPVPFPTSFAGFDFELLATNAGEAARKRFSMQLGRHLSPKGCLSFVFSSHHC